MSSSAPGKFQDHYIVLGVETNADAETIQTAYSKLAQKFHSANSATGDPEKFAAVNMAYEVLSDPGLRASFDQVKGVDHEAGNPKFTGTEFFQVLEQSAGLRSAVLCILYDRRRVKSFKPSLSMRLLEGMLTVNGEALNFALWYLKKRAFVTSDDKSSMEITVEGMDFLEHHRPEPETVLAFIKEDALLNPIVQEKPVAPAPKVSKKAEPKVEELPLNALSRAVEREPDTKATPPKEGRGKEPRPRLTLTF